MLMAVTPIEELRAEAFDLAARHVSAARPWVAAFEYPRVTEADGSGAHHKSAVEAPFDDVASAVAAAAESMRQAGYTVIASLDFPFAPFFTANHGDLLVRVTGYEPSRLVVVEATRPLR